MPHRRRLPVRFSPAAHWHEPFPDAMVCDIVPLSTRSSSLTATSWNLKVSDGQTLYVKDWRKLQRRAQTVLPVQREGTEKQATLAMRQFTSTVQALKVPVADVGRAHHFYADILGLPVVRESKNAVNFGGIFTLVSAASNSVAGTAQSIICIEVSHIVACHAQILSAPVKSIQPIVVKSGRRYFTFTDLDGKYCGGFRIARTCHLANHDRANGELGMDLSMVPPDGGMRRACR